MCHPTFKIGSWPNLPSSRLILPGRSIFFLSIWNISELSPNPTRRSKILIHFTHLTIFLMLRLPQLTKVTTCPSLSTAASSWSMKTLELYHVFFVPTSAFYKSTITQQHTRLARIKYNLINVICKVCVNERVSTGHLVLPRILSPASPRITSYFTTAQCVSTEQ